VEAEKNRKQRSSGSATILDVPIPLSRIRNVNDTLVRRLWPKKAEALGRRLGCRRWIMAFVRLSTPPGERVNGTIRFMHSSPRSTSSIRLKKPPTDQVRNFVWLRGLAAIRACPQFPSPLSSTQITSSERSSPEIVRTPFLAQVDRTNCAG